MPEFTIQDGNVAKQGVWTGSVIEFQGERYKVTKINPANYKIMGTDGKTYNLRRTASVTLAEDQSWDGPREKTEYEKYLEAVEAGITLGTAVKLDTQSLVSKYGTDTYVVIAMPNNGTLRLAKLGGDGGRYLRNITAEQVEVVSV